MPVNERKIFRECALRIRDEAAEIHGKLGCN